MSDRVYCTRLVFVNLCRILSSRFACRSRVFTCVCPVVSTSKAEKTEEQWLKMAAIASRLEVKMTHVSVVALQCPFQMFVHAYHGR